jgi:hypothetical protein
MQTHMHKRIGMHTTYARTQWSVETHTARGQAYWTSRARGAKMSEPVYRTQNDSSVGTHGPARHTTT